MAHKRIKPPEKHKDGRSRKEIVEAICDRIAKGERTHAACSAEGIVWSTLWDWKAADADLATRYARAREASAYAWEDKGTEVVEDENVETDRARVREGHYRWRAKVANPATFGDRNEVIVGGGIKIETLVSGSMDRKPA